MTADWTRMYDACGDVDRVPELLALLRHDAQHPRAWNELGFRLILEHDTVFPASFAALPDLVRLAPTSRPARELAGAIVQRAAGGYDCAGMLERSASVIAKLRAVLDEHLRTRPDDYLLAFRSLIATAGQFHWSAAIEDFTDDFYQLACPHCALTVTIAIGDHGRYSAVRDWNLGDIDRRALRPAAAADLSGVNLWMYATAVRDGQEVLALGLSHLFGQAECPRCASVFDIAAEYSAANLPVIA